MIIAPHRTRLGLVPLEDRTVPAGFSFTLGGDEGAGTFTTPAGQVDLGAATQSLPVPDLEVTLNAETFSGSEFAATPTAEYAYGVLQGVTFAVADIPAGFRFTALYAGGGGVSGVEPSDDWVNEDGVLIIDLTAGVGELEFFLPSHSGSLSFAFDPGSVDPNDPGQLLPLTASSLDLAGRTLLLADAVGAEIEFTYGEVGLVHASWQPAPGNSSPAYPYAYVSIAGPSVAAQLNDVYQTSLTLAPDPVVTVAAISDAAEGGADGVFRFTRTGDTSAALTVDFTVGGTATPGDDYAPLGTSVTFPVGESTVDVTVDVTDDTTPEFAEGVTVTILDGTTYAVGAPAWALVAISDNETPVVEVTRTFDAVEGVHSGFFTLTRTGDATNALTVNVSLAGTATEGTDYTAVGTTVAFAAGSDVAHLEVAAGTDSVYDPDETVIVTLGGGTGYVVGTSDEATLSIEDAIPLIGVERVMDATEDGTDGFFLFTRTGDLSDPLTISYTVGGTATSGTDFTALGGSVTFEADATEVFVTLVPIDDATADPGEVVTLTIPTGTGYVVGLSPASAMIVDDESPVVTVTKVVDAAEDGATGVFRFDRTGDTTNSLTVSYTLSGTAVGGTDFANLSGTVTFASGEQSADVSVVPTNDTQAEGTETVIAAVTSSSTYGAAPNAMAVMSLSDDDGTDGRIGGIMWNDTDGDGLREAGEAPLVEHPVSLLNEAGDYLFDTVTDADGEYEFIGLTEGVYAVKVFAPGLSWYTNHNQGSDEASDSDIDPATGQSDPILLTTQNMVSLFIGGGFTPITVPNPPPSGTILVNFTRPDSSPLAADSPLKIAKWSDAFQVNPNDADRPLGEQRPSIRGPVRGFDFIDRDPDRFNVWVFDLASWNSNTQHITVNLSTTNVAGYAAYNDDATAVSLIRIDNQTGWYWSESQILVSNEIDDKYGNPDAPYIQMDDSAPSATLKHPNGQYTSDRTHRIALGGTVTASYTVGGITVTQSATVPVVKVVKVHVTNMKHLPGNDGDPAVADAIIDADIKVARETFAQVGIRVDVVGQYQTKAPPANLDLSDGLDVARGWSAKTGDMVLTPEEQRLLPEYRTETQTDIEIYYVRSLWVNPQAGRRVRQLGQAYTAFRMKDPAIAGWASSIAIDGEYNTLRQGGGGPWMLAHEMLHILTNDPFHYGKEREPDPNKDQELPTARERTNVLVTNNKAIRTGAVVDSRRLTALQEAKIYTMLLGLLHNPD